MITKLITSTLLMSYLLGLFIYPFTGVPWQMHLILIPATFSAAVSIHYLFAPKRRPTPTDDGLPRTEESNDVRMVALILVHLKMTETTKTSKDIIEGLAKIFPLETIDKAFDYVAKVENQSL